MGSEKFFIRQFLLSYFFDYDALFRAFRDGLSTPVNVFEFNLQCDSVWSSVEWPAHMFILGHRKRETSRVHRE